mmetsp:Transcript_23859/g.56854  ORF Transcript_23859/g.56854 Transcript_23859/m.56854 type:complete len:243 (+) Transcript_23859:742-1470(+)
MRLQRWQRRRRQPCGRPERHASEGRRRRRAAGLGMRHAALQHVRRKGRPLELQRRRGQRLGPPLAVQLPPQAGPPTPRGRGQPQDALRCPRRAAERRPGCAELPFPLHRGRRARLPRVCPVPGAGGGRHAVVKGHRRRPRGEARLGLAGRPGVWLGAQAACLRISREGRDSARGAGEPRLPFTADLCGRGRRRRCTSRGSRGFGGPRVWREPPRGGAGRARGESPAGRARPRRAAPPVLPVG